MTFVGQQIDFPPKSQTLAETEKEGARRSAGGQRVTEDNSAPLSFLELTRLTLHPSSLFASVRPEFGATVAGNTVTPIAIDQKGKQGGPSEDR
jgi:hypothetical protein